MPSRFPSCRFIGDRDSSRLIPLRTSLSSLLLLVILFAVASMTGPARVTASTGVTQDYTNQEVDSAKTSVTLLSPRDYQVFQRHDRTSGNILIKLNVEPNVQQIEFRLLANSNQGTNAGSPSEQAEWQSFPLPSQNGDEPADENSKERSTTKSNVSEIALAAKAGGWYRLEIRWSEKDASKESERDSAKDSANDSISRSIQVEHVGIGEVFIVAGQSNSANHGSVRLQPEDPRVVSFDGQAWRPAADPQLGASGEMGSFIPPLGDLLAKELDVPIGFASIGAGGTSVRQWLPKGDLMEQQPTTGGVDPAGEGKWASRGDLFIRFQKRHQQLGPRGFRAVLWHQGESDAGQARAGYPADRQITGAQYAVFMKRLITAAREDAGWEVPWLTAQTTYHSEEDPSDEEFRTAQRSLWIDGISRQGADTDQLRQEYRDGVHFNEKGLKQHANLWLQPLLKLCNE